MPCSGCRQTGHNIRTCPSNNSVSSASVHAANYSSYSQSSVYTDYNYTEATYKSSASMTEKKLLIPTSQGGSSESRRPKKSGENVSTAKYSKDVNTSLTSNFASSLPLKELKEITLVSNEINSSVLDLWKVNVKGDDTNTLSSKAKSSLSKPKTTETVAASQLIKDKNLPPGSSKAASFGSPRAAAVAKNELPISEVKTRGRKSTAARKGVNWLNEKALKRLEEGPTPKDTEGFIYIYKDKDATSDGNKKESVYKIGCSKNLPERRVKDQQSKNKKEYQIVASFETPHKFVTDTVIKHQLEQFNTPKEDGDGRTEWYTGSVEQFTDTIAKVIREVKGQHYEARAN